MEQGKVKKITYKDRVAEFIYKEIIKGNIKPKEQIKETHLSETLNISRAPIREALNELTSVGILEYRPHIGTFLTDLTADDILNAYITRGVLEGFAASISFPKLTKGDINRLYSMCDKMEMLAEKNENVKLIYLGDKFHEKLFSICGNKELVKFTKMLSMKSHLMFSKYWPKLYLPKQINERHKKIVKAIESGNPKTIEREIRNHYTETGKKIAKLKKEGV